MSRETTLHGLVLRRRDAGESDRRLTVLTREEGVIDVIAKGAKKAGSRLAGSSEPLAIGIMHVAAGKRNRYITQIQPVTSFPKLRGDFDKLSHALALSELASAVLPQESLAEDEFDFMVRALKYLELHPNPIVVAVWSQLTLMGLTGFMPEWRQCVVCGRDGDFRLTAHGGGVVCDLHGAAFNDVKRVLPEALYGLRAVCDLSEPPANLKHADRCLLTLFPFWREIAGKPLPANDNALQNVSLIGV